MFTKVAIDDYGLIRKDDEYEVIDEGNDWLLIRSQGKTLYTFKWAFE